MANIDDLRIEHSPTEGASPSRFRLALAVGLFIILLMGAGGIAWKMLIASTDDRPSTNRTVTSVASTTAGETLAKSSGPLRAGAGALTAGGYVEIIPPGPTVISTRVDGWVRSVEVIEGETVRAGQALVLLDDSLHRQALAEAEAEVALVEARWNRIQAGFRSEEIAEAEARWRKAESRVTFARSEVERYEGLVEIGASPAQRLKVARAELASAEAELAGARALLDLRRAGQRPEDIAIAQAELNQAEIKRQRLRWQVDQCVIRAPTDGVVLERFVRVGDWIAPGQDQSVKGSAPSGERSAPGAVLTLFDPRRVQVWVEVNQRDAGRVYVGQRVLLRADALRDRTIDGRITRIMPRANLQRNTVEVKVELIQSEDSAKPTEILRPEMSVQVTFPEQETPLHKDGEGNKLIGASQHDQNR